MDAATPEKEHPQTVGESPGLSEPLLRYLEARGILLTLEAQEALAQTIRVLIYASIAGLSLFFFWLLLGALAVAALMSQAGLSWQHAVAALAAFHLVVGVIFLLAMRNRLASMRWFGDTFNEFKKDRAWLSRQTGKR